MTATGTESIPADWDDARDVPFFRITARLFSPTFCLGARVLLGDDDITRVQFAPVGPSAGPSAPATDDSSRTGAGQR